MAVLELFTLFTHWHSFGTVEGVPTTPHPQQRMLPLLSYNAMQWYRGLAAEMGEL